MAYFDKTGWTVSTTTNPADADHIIDNNPDSYWRSGGADLEHIIIDMLTARTFNVVRFTPWPGSGPEPSPNIVRLYGSEDGALWTLVLTDGCGADGKPSGLRKYQLWGQRKWPQYFTRIPNPVTFRYIRISTKGARFTCQEIDVGMLTGGMPYLGYYHGQPTANHVAYENLANGTMTLGNFTGEIKLWRTTSLTFYNEGVQYSYVPPDGDLISSVAAIDIAIIADPEADPAAGKFNHPSLAPLYDFSSTFSLLSVQSYFDFIYPWSDGFEEWPLDVEWDIFRSASLWGGVDTDITRENAYTLKTHIYLWHSLFLYVYPEYAIFRWTDHYLNYAINRTLADLRNCYTDGARSAANISH